MYRCTVRFETRIPHGSGNAKTGSGLHGEVGYRWGRIEAQGNFHRYNSATKKNSYRKIAGGLNFFLQGHHAKIQAEFASVIANASLDTTPASHQNRCAKSVRLLNRSAFSSPRGPSPSLTLHVI